MAEENQNVMISEEFPDVLPRAQSRTPDETADWQQEYIRLDRETRTERARLKLEILSLRERLYAKPGTTPSNMEFEQANVDEITELRELLEHEQESLALKEHELTTLQHESKDEINRLNSELKEANSKIEEMRNNANPKLVQALTDQLNEALAKNENWAEISERTSREVKSLEMRFKDIMERNETLKLKNQQVQEDNITLKEQLKVLNAAQDSLLRALRTPQLSPSPLTIADPKVSQQPPQSRTRQISNSSTISLLGFVNKEIKAEQDNHRAMDFNSVPKTPQAPLPRNPERPVEKQQSILPLTTDGTHQTLFQEEIKKEQTLPANHFHIEPESSVPADYYGPTLLPGQKYIPLSTTPNMLGKARLSDLPQFSGYNSKLRVDQWIDQMEKFGRTHRLPPGDMVSLGLNHALVGEAKAWFDENFAGCSDTEGTTWRVWRHKLLEEFTDNNKKVLKIREFNYLNFASFSNIVSYAKAKKRLRFEAYGASARQIYPEQRLIEEIFQLIDGVARDQIIRVHLGSVTPTWNTFIRALELYFGVEGIRNMHDPCVLVKRSNLTPRPAKSKQIINPENMPLIATANAQQIKKDTQNNQEAQDKAENPKPRVPRCNSCGKDDHGPKNCEKAQKGLLNCEKCPHLHNHTTAMHRDRKPLAGASPRRNVQNFGKKVSFPVSLEESDIEFEISNDEEDF